MPVNEPPVDETSRRNHNIAFMNHKLLHRHPLTYRSLIVGFSSLLLGSLVPASALAKLPKDPSLQILPPSSFTTADSPTLEDLWRTIPTRPTAPPVAAPAVSEPDAPASAAEAESAAEEQAIRLLLRLSERKVYVYRGETLETSYPVAIGRAGWETPVGEYEVFSQIVDPGWTNPLTDEVMPPGPQNPLGERWMGFWTDGTNVIGFHGTPNRKSVGTAASHGCVRMYNEHVRELYELVSLGTPVVVEP
ncbi:MAG: L,D-transpeptidase [Phormidesmis sp.]